MIVLMGKILAVLLYGLSAGLGLRGLKRHDGQGLHDGPKPHDGLGQHAEQGRHDGQGLHDGPKPHDGRNRRSGRSSSAAKGMFVAAVLVQSAVIGFESVSTRGTLLSGPNIVMLVSWVLAAVTAIGLFLTKRGMAFAAVVAPVSAILILAAQGLELFAAGSIGNQVYRSWPLLASHIVLVFVACACFATSAAASGWDLYQRRLIKRKVSSLLDLETPPLDTLGKVAGSAAVVGLFLFMAALVMGCEHAATLVVQGGRDVESVLYLVPRIILSLVTLVLWCAYVFLSMVRPWMAQARTRCYLALAGFLCALALVLVSAV